MPELNTQPPLVQVCAWCPPRRLPPAGVRVTHTICPTCLRRVLDEDAQLTTD